MNLKIYPLGRKENLVMQELENEVLLYDLKANKAFCLNYTSAMVWQLCDGTKSIAEISQNLSQKLFQPINEEVIWLALDQLKKESLLTNGEVLEPSFNRLSRREVIRKVGFTSMIALPLISSVIAPNAINAQSTSGCAGLACTGTGFAGQNGCCAGFSCLNVSFMFQCIACQAPAGTSSCGFDQQCCSGICDGNTAQCA